MASTPLTVVIFGASGDLTARKLVPALFNLHRKGRLPDEARVLGVSRSKYDDQGFRDYLRDKIRNFFQSSGEHWDDGEWAEFSKQLHYVATDPTAPDGMGPLKAWFDETEGPNGGRRLYYLSVKPELYPGLSVALGEAGFAKESGGFRRLVIEKPFGHNGETAAELNRVLHQNWQESQLYRIDHYLGKETVQNIMIFRFANTLFEPLWNYQYIDHVQITAAETVTVGSRAAFYDTAGVLRDMFQSHILQVMTMVAMESPGKYSADSMRNEKMKVLDAITVAETNGKPVAVVGQYEGYRTGEGVRPGTKTPTYAAVKFNVENARWKNVPFYLRSGKGLKARYSEVMIQFRCPPHLMFPLPAGETLQCNRMTMVIQPNESIQLNFQTKVPDVDGVRLQPRDLSFSYKDAYAVHMLPEAYERLLLDAIQGDASLFMRSDEIERAWAIMDPVITATEGADAPDPAQYLIGSQGPAEAAQMMEADGRTWHPLP